MDPDVVVEVLSNDAKVTRIIFEPSFQGLCLGGPYIGKVLIEYRPAATLIEFMTFETWLQGESLKGTHTGEEMCRIIFDKMTELVGMVDLRVTLGGMTIAHGPATQQISRGF